MSETVRLDRVDRAVVNAFQGGFPVVERPFEPAAAALRERGVEVTAEELVERVRRLDEEGVLSRFGPLVDAEAIGGTATLVAMHAPPEEFDEVADLVNAHREVAHNYQREHPHLNMWFVLSVADESEVDRVLAEIEAETGQPTYDMPKRREFRVEAKFLLDGPVADGAVDLSGRGPEVEPTDAGALTPEERDLVLAVQDGLPITATPYRDVAEGLSAASWIYRLQVELAETAIEPHIWLSGGQGVIEMLPAAAGVSRQTAQSDLGICPYMGLRPFGEDDDRYFFGREALTQTLLAQLHHHAFLAVVGASGSSKSSVVRAGLIAQLRQGQQIPGAIGGGSARFGRAHAR